MSLNWLRPSNSSAGRPLKPEAAFVGTVFDRPEFARRRQVLRETLQAFQSAKPANRYHLGARDNLSGWQRASCDTPNELNIQVVAGDWGEVTASLTRKYGQCFAVLNMANAIVPGGAYIEGTVAQEENMFRRTDCHFHIGSEEYNAELDRYKPEMTELLSARNGRVYLDTQHPRVCIRGAEDRSKSELGYPWLTDDQIFPFYELRAAAMDLRNGTPFDPVDGRQRIASQLETIKAGGIRYAVLSAFGCGAFQNPADQVASIYCDEIEKRKKDFTVIAFAIFAAGYGPDNFTPFAEILGNRSRSEVKIYA
jgi:hypothetical protein